MDEIYWYARDSYDPKYKLLINKQESRGLKHLNDSKAFIVYSNCINDIYKHIEEYNQNKKRKTLIAFDDMIAGMRARNSTKRIWSFIKYWI